MNDLETKAIAGHTKGQSWETFWQLHGDQVKAAEPYNNQRFRRLVRKLSHLLLCGEASGQFGVGDGDPEPWVRDDDVAGVDDDSATAAVLQLNLPFVNTPEPTP